MTTVHWLNYRRDVVVWINFISVRFISIKLPVFFFNQTVHNLDKVPFRQSHIYLIGL